MATRQAYVEILRSRNGEYRWRLRAGNGEIVASGEGHPTCRHALRAWHTVERIVLDGGGGKGGLNLPIVNLTTARRPR
jgi:uncharacterized protein YegP (UPF0339 family)